MYSNKVYNLINIKEGNSTAEHNQQLEDLQMTAQKLSASVLQEMLDEEYRKEQGNF